MLQIIVPERKDLFNEMTNKFETFPGAKLNLEHSLISIAKWERKWHKPYLSKLKEHEKTAEEVLDYIRCMTINTNVDPDVYKFLTKENLLEIKEYINDPATATTIISNNTAKAGVRSSKFETAETIYYSMIEYGIPFECDKWHLNQLLTLIHVCNVRSDGEKKMSKSDTMKMYADLNAQRRKAHHSKG